jgi:hypothetical protein
MITTKATPAAAAGTVLLSAVFALVLAALACGPSASKIEPAPDDMDLATQYLAAPMNDPVACLQQRLARGEAKLEWHTRHGYLRAVLRELGISPASQMLVFSKTSLQREHISPNTPRAIYYNDRCYVGWVQNGRVLEISAVDPKWGGVFYTLSQEKTQKPRFVRQTYDCLQCHSSPTTDNIPGHIVRSVFVRGDGNPELSAGSFLTTPESPFSERWGGWYVSGTHGSQRHMGNVVARGSDPETLLDRDRGANVSDLSKFVDTAPYLSGHSDIVALMVLEHQTHPTICWPGPTGGPVKRCARSGE